VTNLHRKLEEAKDRRVVDEKDRNRRCSVVCCSALQCVSVCCSVLQGVAAKDQRVVDEKDRNRRCDAVGCSV